MHVKLKSGVDLVTYIVEDDSVYVTIKDPVQFGFDPSNGIYGINWLLLSESSTIKLLKSDIYFINIPSAKANEFYNQFDSNINHKPDDTDYTSDLENIFNALLESRSNTKH